MLSSAPLFHAMTVWSVALEAHFGWSRTQLSMAFAFTRIEGGIMGPIEGYLTDRVGPKRMVFIGLVVLAIGFLFFWQVKHLWMFYLAFVIMSLGHSLCGWVPVTTLLNNWFIRNRAKAMGWSNTFSRLGALILVPAIAWAINPDKDRLGWDVTALALGIFSFLVAVPMYKVIRNRPEEYNLLPDGLMPLEVETSRNSQDSGKEVRQIEVQQDTQDLTTAQALKTVAFWLISIGHGLTSMVIIAIMAHLGLFMSDNGFDIQTTAWVVSVYTFVAMVFPVVGGYVGDRIPIRIAIFVFTSIQAFSVVILTFATTLPLLYVFAVLFGIGFGGRSPLTTAIRGDYFGRRSFGKILGISTVPLNILLLVAAPFAGYMYDTTGSYRSAFLILAALSFVGGVFFLLAKKPDLSVINS